MGPAVVDLSLSIGFGTVGACVSLIGEIYNNYINRSRRFVYSSLLCEFTDTCEDFNDFENRDGLTVCFNTSFE